VYAVRFTPYSSTRRQLNRAVFALCLVVVFSIWLGRPATAASVDLVAYRQAVQTSLSDLKNNQRSAEYVAANLRAITSVTLPDGSTLSPDLTLVLSDLSADPVRLNDAERQLSALLIQLDQAVGTNSNSAELNAAHGHLQQILARSEFQPKSSRHSQTFFGWLFQKIGRLLSPVLEPLGRLVVRAMAWFTRSNSVWSVIGTIVGLVALSALFFWFVRGVRHSFGPAVARFPVAENGERPSAINLRDEAETLARRRSYRLAIRALYLAALLRLDERGVLSFERTLTNREVLREAGASGSLQLVDQLAPLVERFDRHWYGAVSCTEDDFREFTRLASWAWEVA